MRYSLVPAQEGNRVILTPHYMPPLEAVSEQTYVATVGSVTRLSVVQTVVSTRRLQGITQGGMLVFPRCLMALGEPLTLAVRIHVDKHGYVTDLFTYPAHSFYLFISVNWFVATPQH